MRSLLAFALALLLVAGRGHAQASREPSIAPPGEWVERVAIPASNPALGDRPFQALLSTSQSLYGAEHHDHYVEWAFLIQNAQGLQGLGNIVLPWQPDQSELIVHKVQIVRGGTVIDLLANGQRFTVLRRENNLESAVLDGVLTAVMQPEGLAVGDTLNIAYGVRRRAGTLPLRGENYFVLAPGMSVRRYSVRQIWPAGTAMRWRGTGALERPRTRSTRFGTELSADLVDVETPPPPALAPARFNFPTTLQITEFRDWAEIGAMVAPHYERARDLAPDSPLRSRIGQIAAENPDPRARAMAALRLVQDEVRYFALIMGDGNYLPATADQTWSRRFADCKGKVVLLVALLRGLGIEAEPVLVNAEMGDGMNERLPQMIVFNHMIVRARIDGRSYWLDGTRTGDRILEDLASSTFGWGLPIRASGSGLEQLPLAPPSLPLVEHNVVYDGSGGFLEPVSVRVEWTYRGDPGQQIRIALSQVGREEFLRQARGSHSNLPGDNDEVTAIDLRDDPATGSFTLIVTGKARMDWRPAPGAAAQRFRFDNEMIHWRIDLDRPAGPFRDAPYSFPVPAYLARTETVILPNGGQGFSIDGQGFDQVVAGTRISRRLEIANGRATARSEFRRIEREVSAASARQAKTRIDAIGDDEAWLRAPMGTAVPRSRNLANDRPGSAEALVSDGYAKMSEDRVRPALADFDRAIALAPEWAKAHAYRGMALTRLNRLDEAGAALATAVRLDDTEFAGHVGLGDLYLRRGQLEEAIPAFTRSLELHPENILALGERADAYLGLGRTDEALADLDRILTIEPRHAMTQWHRARLFAHLGRDADAIAAIDSAFADDRGNFNLATSRGDMLARLGRADAAATAYREALAILDAMVTAIPAEWRGSALLEQRMVVLTRSGRYREAIALADAQLRQFAGNVPTLAARCWTRMEANVELALALRDCDEALRAEPGHPSASPARARLMLRLARWAEAERAFTQLLETETGSRAAALHGRGLARIRRGDRAGGESDLAAARRAQFDIDKEFTRIGLGLPAEAAAAPAPGN